MDRTLRTVSECIGAAITLRRTDPAALDPAQVHARLKGFVDRMLKKAAEEGFSQQDAQDLGYAVVALLDEVALTRSDAMNDFWMSQTLQFQYFRENRAGENFFRRLQAVRGDPNRRDVLRVYYWCLSLGFQGRYRVRGGDLELIQLRESLARDLAQGRAVSADVISPHGARPPERATSVARRLPLIAYSAGAIALALFVYAGLRFAISSQASSLTQTVSARVVR